MESEFLDREDSRITIRDQTWCRGQQDGTVAAKVRLPSNRDFTEVAVLVDVDNRAHGYGVRVKATDQWVYFENLQPWMHPLIEELIAALASKGRLAEIVDGARRVLARATDD